MILSTLLVKAASICIENGLDRDQFLNGCTITWNEVKKEIDLIISGDSNGN